MKLHFRIPALAIAALTALTLNPLSADGIVFDPLPGAPYSAAATIPPTYGKIFTGTYTGSGTGREAQARNALQKLSEDLQAAGLDLGAVVNVRSYLKVLSTDAEENANAMAQWNAAWNPAFADFPATPTRTTFGVYTLEDPDAVIAIEAVAAAPLDTIRNHKPRLGNPRIHHIAGPHQTLTYVEPFTSLVLTSGVLADPLNRDRPTEFGTMAQQTASTLKKLEASLRHWGLTPNDVAYARVLISPELIPDAKEPVPVDFTGYLEANSAFWKNAHAPLPPIGIFAAPGFNTSGRTIEIEFYAAFPDSASQVFAGDSTRSFLDRRNGVDTSFLNSSVAIARDATLVWFAGVIDQTRQNIHGQAVETLLNLNERMDKAGVTFGNIVMLRAYLQIENTFQADFGNWNTAYQRFFNITPVNPNKPVRTAFPVISIPGSAVIEIEAIGVK